MARARIQSHFSFDDGAADNEAVALIREGANFEESFLAAQRGFAATMIDRCNAGHYTVWRAIDDII